ncbi:MAG: site-specific DNA-methyltransferase, partial [Candidatus Spyradenecus sp.]
MSPLEHIMCATPDFAEETVKKILSIVPECEGERGTVDFDKLRQALSSSVIEGNVERYEFTWPGKRAAKAAASAATTKTLRPCREESVGKDGTPGGFDSQNLYIEGDNLEVLKLLQSAYANQVKMIYIDPPYNTGHDFVYRDRFSMTTKEIAEAGGALDDGSTGGGILAVNDSAEARYHSNWCSMMYPRLKLARNLLRDDGVILISLDDSEAVNIRKLCDEIFGEANFIAQISVVSNPRGRDYGGVAKMHEYVFVYRKSDALCLSLVKDEKSEFPFTDDKGGFELRELRNRNVKFNKGNRPNLYYPFYINPSKQDENGL